MFLRNIGMQLQNYCVTSQYITVLTLTAGKTLNVTKKYKTKNIYTNKYIHIYIYIHIHIYTYTYIHIYTYTYQKHGDRMKCVCCLDS
jgi:hypothetical protein